MTLPLPYVVRDPDAQGNLDKIAMQFPLGIEHLKTGIVLQLATTGTARKVAFGSNTWASVAANNGATTITHGLGATPVAMGATASDALVVMAADTVGATTFRAWFRYADGVNRTTSGTFYWWAFG